MRSTGRLPDNHAMTSVIASSSFSVLPSCRFPLPVAKIVEISNPIPRRRRETEPRAALLFARRLGN